MENIIDHSSVNILELENGRKLFQSFKEFKFELGGKICPLNLVFETVGKMSSEKDNIILINHALSVDCHFCSHPNNLEKGWWENMVGPGKAIDTDQFFVICINNLGSCFGSSSPISINPSSGKKYSRDFPKFTINDIVNSQYLLLSLLGIKKLYAIIGNSMGGMISLAWTILYPKFTRRMISISSCYKSNPISIAIHDLQREAIELGIENNEKSNCFSRGFILARKFGLISYRHPTELNTRFKDHELQEYLNYNAKKFCNNFDAYSYLYLIYAMDIFDVTRGYENENLPFQKIQASVLILSVSSDLLFPPQQQFDLYRQLKEANVDVIYKELQSTYGHDAFYSDNTIKEQLHSFLTQNIEVV